MKRFMVVFENAPLDNAPWITSACSATQLFLVDNDVIAEVMSKDPDARNAILGSQQAPWGINESLTRYYRKAFDQVAAGKPRLGLTGSNWLVYADKPDLCIIDFDPLEAEGQRGIQGGVSPQEAAKYVKQYTDELTQRARKHLPADRVLILPKGTPDANKSELAVSFIRKFG